MTQPRQSRFQTARTVLLAALVLGLPVAGYFALKHVPVRGSLPFPLSGGQTFATSLLPLSQRTIGPEPVHAERITNVQILDFDEDGLNDVLACDSRRNRVLWYRQAAGGDWQEETLAKDVCDPAHATVTDLDQDGDRDVVVSVLGNISPDDGVIGQILLLERDGDSFRKTVLWDDVRRVADCQAGDLDGDGDLDLAVAVFGYARGQVLWLENRGGLRFRPHQLLYAAGAIHVPLADYDGDGDLDIATVVSQEDEELWAFENDGSGQFQPRRLFFTPNFDLGSAGLVRTDLDSDGDFDLLLPVGDNLEYDSTYPQPYHGCLWFENQGDWNFQQKRIARFGGTFAAATGDLDGDADRDVVLVSMANEWYQPGRASIVWLENDGRQNFRTWQISDRPTHLATVACGDLNGDGRDDVVAGSLQLLRERRHPGRITAWLSKTE